MLFLGLKIKREHCCWICLQERLLSAVSLYSPNIWFCSQHKIGSCKADPHIYRPRYWRTNTRLVGKVLHSRMYSVHACQMLKQMADEQLDLRFEEMFYREQFALSSLKLSITQYPAPPKKAPCCLNRVFRSKSLRFKMASVGEKQANCISNFGKRFSSDSNSLETGSIHLGSSLPLQNTL